MSDLPHGTNAAVYIDDLVSDLPHGTNADVYVDALVLWCLEEYATSTDCNQLQITYQHRYQNT